MAKLFDEFCPACGGDGRAGLYEGVGPHGQDCPYCYPYRENYVIGQVPKHATTLPTEHTGERFFHVFDKQTRAPTSERRGFRIVERPHVAHGPIERPRRRTLPLLSPVGVVRHWTTNTLMPRFKTGPVTKQHRYDEQIHFLKVRPYLKADQQRRENAVFCLTIISWIVVSLCAVALLAFVIIAVLYHFMTP